VNRDAVRRRIGWPHQALRFAATGAINTLLCLSVIVSLESLFGVGDVLANLTGYSVGLGTSFLLNRRWTFESNDRWMPALLRFLGVFAGAYLLNIAVVLGLLRAGLNDYLAHVGGMPFYTAAFYIGCRYLVFSSRTAD
jgi:putative flippase GtrA